MGMKGGKQRLIGEDIRMIEELLGTKSGGIIVIAAEKKKIQETYSIDMMKSWIGEEDDNKKKDRAEGPVRVSQAKNN
jgi:hypothetical protein